MSRLSKKHKIIGVIPARGGSKGIPKKNIKLLGGHPLIAYSIIVSKLSARVEQTIVSTDSQEIADIALFYGAEVPFLRPPEISQDNSTDLELFQHAINWFKEKEEIMPTLLVHLRPTTPLRIPSEVDNAIDYIKEESQATSLRSAHELPEPPQKMFQVDEKGFFNGFFPDHPKQEYYNLPRQFFPKAYHPNGYVDIIKPDFVQKTNSLHGPNILAFVTSFAAEVDSLESFEYLEYRLSKYGNPIYEYLKEHFPEES
ncbi:acylneuraminate cytidylyltransferase family protein [bacterium]|nr:acylneuraminate cytidylyltransferase family protein [bacterium]